MVAIIYAPAKAATQSGPGNQSWCLSFAREVGKPKDPLMGWTGSQSTSSQVKLNFESLDAAIAYAKAKGIPYRLKAAQSRQVKSSSYADNFSSSRKQSWTH